MWGQDYHIRYLRYSLRIIPMRVGTRFTPVIFSKYEEDHPHACGDKPCKDPAKLAMIGSSPCVWGQGKIKAPLGRGCGIIPMRVGTSFQRCTRTQAVRDHPHACGDKVSVYKYRIKVVGSSPCVWGQGENLANVGNYSGIIPMRVGTRCGSP